MELRWSCLRVLTSHLKSSHHGRKPLVVIGVSLRQSWYAGVLVDLSRLPRRRHVASEGWLEVRNRKSNLLNQPPVRLSGNNLQFDENPFRSLHIFLLVNRVDEGAGEDLVHDSDSIDLIAQNVRQNVISR